MNTLPEILKALEKAADALDTAEYDLKGGFMHATVNRVYYCIFYCMTALLYSEGVYAKTHQGARAKFGELFIKTGILPSEMANHARNAYDLRQEADYDLDAQISEEEAKILLQNAHDFYRMSSEYLQNRIKQ